MWFRTSRWPLHYNPNWPGFENSYRARAIPSEDATYATYRRKEIWHDNDEYINDGLIPKE